MKNLMRLMASLMIFFGGVIALPTTSSNAATLSPLVLVRHTFNVTTATQLRFVFEDDSRFTGNAVEIELHRRVASRRSFQSIAQGDVRPGVLDALTLNSLRVSRVSNELQFSIPISQRVDSSQALFIAFDGVYPITIRIRDSKTRETIAEVLTFIHVDRESDASKAVQFSTLVRLKPMPSLQPDGSMNITEQTRTEVSQFIEFLRTHTYPMTVSVQPEIIEALATSPADSDKALFVALREQLRQRTITTAPFVPTDPSMFVVMNMREEFIQQIRVGEDTLNRWLPGVAIQRSTYIADHYLTSEGLTLLRTAGIVSVILAPRAQQKIDVSRTSNVVLRPNGINSNNVSVVAVDAEVSASMQRDTNSFSPSLVGYRAAAELLVARDDLLSSGHTPSSVRFLLASPSGKVNKNDGTTIASEALSEVSGLRSVDMATPQSSTTDSGSVRFSGSTPNTGAARVAGITVARRELRATASMADPTDIRRELWAHLFAIGVSNTVVNGDEYIAGLRTTLGNVRGAVTVTTPDTITLSGRSGAIRIQIRNDSKSALTVRVKMASAKLNLQDPLRVVHLAAGGTTEVKVDAGTRSNGRFPLSIRVTTPEGGLEVVPYIQVTARMNAIAGFGQYLSYFLLVMVLLWWWTHWRRTRSQRVRGTTVSD